MSVRPRTKDDDPSEYTTENGSGYAQKYSFLGGYFCSAQPKGESWTQKLV